MITYFSTWWAGLVSWAISEEARDLIKKSPSHQNQRAPASSQRSPQHECGPGTFCNRPDPAWRGLGTARRKGREEWGRGTDPSSFRKVCWRSEAHKGDLTFLNPPSRALVRARQSPPANGAGKTKQDRQGPHPRLSEARWSPGSPSSQGCGPGCPLLDTGESAGMLIWALTQGRS